VAMLALGCEPIVTRLELPGEVLSGMWLEFARRVSGHIENI